MDQTTLLRVFALLSIAALAAPAAAADAPYVARYRGDCKAALSLTFDDGFRAEVRDALEILDPLGLKGTFFLIPLPMADGGPDAEKFITFEQAKEMIARGHEIGTHGLTKFRLHEVDDATLDAQVNGGWAVLKERTGVAPVSFAVPGGSDKHDARVRAKVLEKHFFLRPDALGYGSAGARVWSDEVTRDRLRKAVAAGEWQVACIHSIVGGYAPFRSKDEFRGHCEWLKAQAADLWVAPMGEVGRYVRLRETARLEILGSGPGNLRFRLTSGLEPKPVFDRPLTVVIPAPGAAAATARDDGAQPLPVTVAGDRILVETPADGRAVTVGW